MSEYPAEARYDKLVRDRIPEIIEADGLRVETRRLEEEEIISHLKAKAVEESIELKAAETLEDIKKEMADLMEVVTALGEKMQISMEEIEQIRLERKAKRGGFDQGIFLERTYKGEE